ncbi:hypothetical protein HU200_006822 [Digitaria exilis]|uniref:Cystatin domain-containing protein n=1 Tax=Digitaria exilis TaxID=1010633 RepID=A0A835KRU0_9POAL|nr:hypothetical protein HU200_006822 [Digitaria exilis]
MMRTMCSLLLVAAVASALAASPTTAQAQGGQYVPIANINDPHIQEIGQWAVAEHVKQANDGLTFSKVVSGEKQVVSGVNFRLVIDAFKGDGKDARYQAIVFEQVWTNTRKLRSFRPAN